MKRVALVPMSDFENGAETGLDKAPPPASAYWIMLAIVWFVYLISCIDRVAWGNVALSVGESLNLKVSALGVFVTAFFVGYVASNIVTGTLCDFIGPRRLLAYTLFPMGICTYLFGSITSIPGGFVLQALMGLAAGADLVAGLKIIQVWFGKHNKGVAAGIFLTGTSAAVVIANLVIPSLMAAIGWSGVYRVLGVLTALCAVIALLALPELPVSPKVSKELNPLDGPFIENRQQAWRFVLIALAGFGAYWGLWGFAFWANALMVKSAHISPVRAGYIVALFGIGALVSKPLIGRAADYLGGRNRGLAIAALVGFTITLLIFGKLKTELAFNLMAPVLGFMAFAFSPPLWAVVAEEAGKARVGIASGFANAFWQLGSLIVPLVVGFAFQESHSFYVAFVTLAVGPAAAAIGLLFMRGTRSEPATPKL